MSRKRKKNYPIVEVTWVDAEEHGEIGWNSTTDLLKYAGKACPHMTTVGYLVHNGKDHIALLSTYSVDLCSTVEKIPRGMIVSIVYLVPHTDQQDNGTGNPE
tara:strand:- start:76 stop:381 length:306 start_codon:yes stop_codon:yes gene_type:complete